MLARRAQPKPQLPTWRRLVRGIRLFLLGWVLLLAGCAEYFNWIGLPDFIVDLIRSDLGQHGFELAVRRVHLRGFRKIEADQIEVKTSPGDGPWMTISKADLVLNWGAVWRGNWEMEGLTLDGADVTLPVVGKEGRGRSIRLRAGRALLRFLPQNRLEWIQDGGFQGASLRVQGSISNAFALRDTASKGAGKQARFAWADRLREWAANTQFSESSSIRLEFDGDARQPADFQFRLRVRAGRVVGPAGEFHDLAVRASHRRDQEIPHLMRGDLDAGCSSWEAEGLRMEGTRITAAMSRTNGEPARVKWQVACRSLQADLTVAHHLGAKGQTILENVDQLKTTATVAVAQFKSGLSAGDNLQITGSIEHALGRTIPDFADCKVTFDALGFKEGKLEHATVRGRLKRRSDGGQPPDVAWGPWTRWRFMDLDWELGAERFQGTGLELSVLQAKGQWRPPEWTVQEIDGQAKSGRVAGMARLDVGTRQVHAEAGGRIELQQLSSLLNTNAQAWLREVALASPPQFNIGASFVLPHWTNSNAHWLREIFPSVQAQGTVEAGEGSALGIPFVGVSGHWVLTNQWLQLTNCEIRRPEGSVVLDYAGDTQSHDFEGDVRSAIDLTCLKSLVKKERNARAFDYAHFDEPPLVEGRFSGDWRKPGAVSFSGKVRANRFSFRGQSSDVLRADVTFTNHVIALANVDIQRGDQQIRAPLVVYEIKEHLLHFTDALSTYDPDAVTTAIGPKIHRSLRPFHFSVPPAVRLNGRVPTTDDAQADVVFEIAGNSFSFWKFNLPEVAVTLHWQGDFLSVSNLNAAFYQGKLDLIGQFDVSDKPGTPCRFSAHVYEADLKLLMEDLVPGTNRLEGILNGTLNITSGNATNVQSWVGIGNAQLRDGFLWDIPVFGFFSPILNKVNPGLGNSRVNSGSASFTLDWGLIRTKDLEVRSPYFRLHYDGSVDLETRVKARMEAEILRDAWLLGKAVSLAFWPVTKALEFKVTGTLNKPVTEPIYIPKLLLIPFRPIKTVKEIFRSSQSNSKEKPRSAEPPSP